MADVVVTLPLSFGLQAWVEEGDPAGSPWSGEDWHWCMSGFPPQILPGESVYFCYNRKLIGYAPLVRVQSQGSRSYSLVRHGEAVAVTIDEEIPGFHGWKPRWWERSIEKPFPNWRHLDAQIDLFSWRAEATS